MIIQPQHQRAIEKLRERFGNDSRYLAMTVGGSVAKGTARENSDLDCALIATDEEWQRRREAHQCWFSLGPEICDYPGGYVEVRTYSLDLLKAVAERGIEVLRSQFVNAIIIFCHRPEIEEIVRRIPVYPEAEREKKMATFYTLMQAWAISVSEAERDGDLYFKVFACGNVVHYAGRLLLAYNRMLYTSSKYLMRRVAAAPDKPEDYIALAEKVLQEPGRGRAYALTARMDEFRDWGINIDRLVNVHLENIEWGWHEGLPGAQDW